MELEGICFVLEDIVSKRSQNAQQQQWQQDGRHFAGVSFSWGRTVAPLEERKETSAAVTETHPLQSPPFVHLPKQNFIWDRFWSNLLHFFNRLRKFTHKKLKNVLVWWMIQLWFFIFFGKFLLTTIFFKLSEFWLNCSGKKLIFYPLSQIWSTLCNRLIKKIYEHILNSFNAAGYKK